MLQENRADDLEQNSVNCLAALSKCMKLQHLDLSLISESISLRDLLHSIMPLTKLTFLRFPRSSTNDSKTNSLFYSWPSNLKNLHLAGGLHDSSLLMFANLPTSLCSLSIGHCPNLTRVFIWGLLPALSPHLTYLKISYPMKQLDHGCLDDVLFKATNLRYLSVAVDYISDEFFLSDPSISSHPLETLELDAPTLAGVAEAPLITADTIHKAIAEGGLLSNVRAVRVSRRFGWDTKWERASLDRLAVLLEEKAGEDEAAAAVTGVAYASDSKVGVWIFE